MQLRATASCVRDCPEFDGWEQIAENATAYTLPLQIKSFGKLLLSGEVREGSMECATGLLRGGTSGRLGKRACGMMLECLPDGLTPEEDREILAILWGVPQGQGLFGPSRA